MRHVLDVLARMRCRAPQFAWKASGVRWAVIAAASALFLASGGCSESAQPLPAKDATPASQMSAVPPRPAGQEPAVSPPASQPAATASPPPADPAPAAPVANPQPQERRSIVGRTTQDVREVPAEQAAGARQVQPRVTGQDPITVAGSAYVTIIGRAAKLEIEHAVNIFHGLNERYPKDLDEFMREIIKANHIRLPELPPYQKYGYDVNKHALVILEYPH